ncbi:phage tail sheath subtilisin-like domain-containing protein [Salmonella enterica]|nr:phage tail sheath subtilisin-like domain-containing protein [Salmonella enterica]
MSKKQLPVAPAGRPCARVTCETLPSALDRWNGGIKAAATDDNSISVFDVIGQDYWGEGVTAKRIAGALRAMNGADVTVNINSPGGDMFEGLAIYNLLREYQGKVTVKVLGIAASAASVIAMAGDDIQIGRGAFLMIHNCWVVAMGNRHDFAELSASLEPFDNAMADIYAARSGLDMASVQKLMDAESYIGGSDAVEKGLADSLLSADAVTRVQAPVTSGDDAAAVAVSIKDAVNANPDLPFTATSEAGVVTLTARHKGLYGNEIPVTLNYYGFGGGEVLPAGVNITVASGVKGAGAPALNDAVAAMGDEPFDYIGLPFNDTASVNTMATEMNDSSGRWSYVRQLYGHVYTAKTGTLSELVAAGDQFNLQHITLAGYEKDTQTPADELAASRTARAAVFIRNDPARPTQTGELVDMLPAPKGKRFTTTEQQTLLSHGVATAYVESGVLRIQRDITTYRKNAYGVADNSYLDSETLHTSAYVLRRLKSVITSKYGRHKLANDGTRFGSGQAIVTPAVIRGELGSTYRQMEREGIVENFDLFQQHLIVERNANNSNRLDVLFPPDYVNQLRVFAVLNQFRLQYSEEAA